MFMLKILAPIILTASLLASPVARAGDREPAAADLVRLVMQAYGGAERLRQVTAIDAEGKIDAQMRGDHGTYKRWLRRQRQLRVEIAYQHNTETRILNDQQVWRSDGKGVMRSAEGPGHMAVIFQFKELDLPYSLLSGAYHLHYAGKEKVEGLETDVLEAVDKEGPPLHIDIDSSTHLIVRVAGYLDLGGINMELAAVYSDFRPVEGIPMAFTIHNFVQGTPVSVTKIQRYSINPARDEDDSLFNPPITKHHGHVLSLDHGEKIHNHTSTSCVAERVRSPPTQV